MNEGSCDELNPHDKETWGRKIAEGKTEAL